MTETFEGHSKLLLQELHILTNQGKLNQDSKRKLKQIQHLYQFIKPYLLKHTETNKTFNIVDHGAGKSYLGFILQDLHFKNLKNTFDYHIYGIETRNELVNKSRDLQSKLNLTNMSFLNLSVSASIASPELPKEINMVTALHACDSATDDAIDFALTKKAHFIFLIPCCQAEVAAQLKQNKKFNINHPLVELYRHGLHTREFGSHLTNTLRCLRLEAHGYDVSVTEFTGLEHSLKNELIIAEFNPNKPVLKTSEKINTLLKEFKIQELSERFKML